LTCSDISNTLKQDVKEGLTPMAPINFYVKRKKGEKKKKKRTEGKG